MVKFFRLINDLFEAKIDNLSKAEILLIKIINFFKYYKA